MAGLRQRIQGVAFVATILIGVSSGTLNMALEFAKDTPLDGAEMSAERPKLEWGAIKREAFQTKLTAWFEQNWGFRGYVARSDNTINAHVFAETRPGSGVVLCNDGVLINAEDVAYLNRTDSPDEEIASAELIARVQQKLLARGTVMIPILMPAKSHFFADVIPASWRLRGAGTALENIYRAFVRAMRAKGVRFVDAAGMLEEPWNPLSVFAKTGRHWRVSAGCRALNAALDLAAPDLPEIGDQRIDCHVHIDPDPSVDVEDYDLFRLANTWDPKPAGMAVEVLDGQHGGLEVPTLFVGSSFVWKFVHVSNELEVLRPSLFYYYDRSVVDTVSMFITKTVEPDSPAWREDTLGKKLIILGILESYLPFDEKQFLEEVDRAIP